VETPRWSESHFLRNQYVPTEVAASGGALGGLIGSFIPIPWVGTAVGAYLGQWAARELYKAWYDRSVRDLEERYGDYTVPPPNFTPTWQEFNARFNGMLSPEEFDARFSPQPGLPGSEFDARFQGAQPLPGGPGFQLGSGTLADYLGDDPGMYGSMAPVGYPGQAADPWQSVPPMIDYRAIGTAAGVAPPNAFSPPAGYTPPARYAPVAAPIYAAPSAGPGFSVATPAGASGYGGWNIPTTGALRPGSSF
jgi:hypothetical protein